MEHEQSVNTNQQWRKNLLRLGAVWGMIILLFAMSGCGWIFKKRGKDMQLNLEITGTDSLNYDGETANAVEVRVYVLKDSHRFMAFNTPVLFDENADPYQLREFWVQDTLRTARTVLHPGKTNPLELIIPYSKARDTEPELAVIANFFNPPLEHTERQVLKLKKNTKQTRKVTVGKDWVNIE